MNYLAKHLNNSLELSYDIMNLIYEYADPFIYVRKQIEKKEYKLNKSCIIHREDIFRIPTHYSIEHKKVLMIYELRGANVYKYKRLHDKKYKMKNVYKKWLNL